MEHLHHRSLEHLAELMEINKPLYQAYLLKEDLRMSWNLPTAKLAQTFLASWIEQARTLGLKYFVKLAGTLEKHHPGPLAYFKHRISTGPLEGLNNKEISSTGVEGFSSFHIILRTMSPLIPAGEK